MTLSCRRATEADHARVLALMEKFYREEQIHFAPAVIAPALMELLPDHSLGQICLLETERGGAGYLVLVYGFILEFGGRQAFLDELYIEPEFRGQGFGRRALELAEEASRQAGIRILRLEVQRTNERAIRLYQKVG